MAGKDEYRIFVGGLSRDITERMLENTFSRFGKIIESQIMVERDTGRSRGFGFITFTDDRDMEDAIREMHGRELGDRTISVNKAQPKMGGNDEHGYGGGARGYSSGGRGSYASSRGRPNVGQDDCFKCGRPGHWARDCPSGGGGPGRGGGRFASRTRFGGPGDSADRFGDQDRYVEDRYDGGRYGEIERYESRDSKYGGFGRHAGDRYAEAADRYGGDRYGALDRYAPGGYGKDRGYERDIPPPAPRGISSRYSAGGPARDEARSYGSRPGPYDRPSRDGGRPSYDRY